MFRNAALRALPMLLLAGTFSSVLAQDPTTADLKIAADTVWVVIAGALVFFMNAGFGMLETGLCRAKNAVNILSKNVIVFGMSCLAFWAIGFGLMFGDGNSFIGLTGWFVSGADNSPAMGEAYSGVFGSLNWTGVPLNAKFFFQLVFAATAATIVSGAVAERIKFLSFMVFSFVMVAIIYPIGGHWIWGGGWLASRGFFDFAGSTVVHSIGGWAALVGTMMLGPRIGKYAKDGSLIPIPGHHMGYCFVGTFILWLGWFGFNPGSTMAADANAIALIAINTNMAAAAGMVVATVLAWVLMGKPDLSMMLNGTLAGLVAITAPCAQTTMAGSIAIGAIGGALVVVGVLFFDRVKVDDPVGALSVHLVNGVWGTLAVGLFSTTTGLLYGHGAGQLGTQALGVLTVGIGTVVVSVIAWSLIKATMGLRVSAAEEIEGLDIGEHGMDAYIIGVSKPSELVEHSGHPVGMSIPVTR
jgi:Amt family ammonium transporter